MKLNLDKEQRLLLRNKQTGGFATHILCKSVHETQYRKKTKLIFVPICRINPVQKISEHEHNSGAGGSLVWMSSKNTFKTFQHSGDVDLLA